MMPGRRSCFGSGFERGAERGKEAVDFGLEACDVAFGIIEGLVAAAVLELAGEVGGGVGTEDSGGAFERVRGMAQGGRIAGGERLADAGEESRRLLKEE